MGVGAIGVAHAVSAPVKEANATDVTYSFAFSAAADLKTAGGTFTSGGIAWTYDTITYLNYSSAKGIQLGSSTSPMNKAWTFHTALSNFGSGLTSVTVNGSIATGGDAKVSVTAGTTTLIAATALTTTAADYTGTSATALSSGELTITFTNTVKAEYFKGVSVIYTAKSYDPVTSITLSKTSGTYSVTGGEAITATVLPTTANQLVTWTTSDEYVATVNGGTIDAVGAGTATITATTNGTDSGGLAKSATFTVTVNSFGIADLRDSAGGILNAGKIVAVTGTVTKVVAGGGVYIQTGTTFANARAVYGYNTGATASSATVGNLCTIKGTITNYSGLLELGSALYKTSATAGETIAPIAISSGFTSTALVGHDSVMISLPSLRLTAATTITSGTAATIACTLGGSESVSLRADKTITTADATTINTMFGKIGTGGAFSYSGVLGWYNGPQASVTSMTPTIFLCILNVLLLRLSLGGS
jgi:hypothetical protein